MRVLLFHDVAGEIGGAETYAFRLLRALNVQGHPARLVALSSAPVEPRENTVVFPEPSGKLSRFLLKATFNPGVFLRLLREIDSFKPEVLHVHHNYKAASAVLLAAALKGVPVVQTVHDYGFICPTIWHVKPHGNVCCERFGLTCVQSGCISLFDYFKELAYRPMKRLMDKALVRIIICPSKALMECISAQGFNAIFVPYFIDCPKKAGVGPSSREKTVLYVGGLTAQKGVHVLLRAFALLLKKIPKAKLTIAGEGSFRGELESLSRELKIDGNVKFEGRVSNKKLYGFYQKASVVAMPSIWVEQFGLVGVEAMSHGVPVVGSDIGGIPEWLEDGKTGLLCRPGDARGLAEKLEKILSNAALARKMGKAGRKSALVKYCSSGKHIARLVEEYESVQ